MNIRSSTPDKYFVQYVNSSLHKSMIIYTRTNYQIMLVSIQYKLSETNYEHLLKEASGDHV